MDLEFGYYQIEMEEHDKPKTAFVCPLGFYEFNRMPQGITNAPSTFQQLMERVMGSIKLKEVLVFWMFEGHEIQLTRPAAAERKWPETHQGNAISSRAPCSI